MMNTSKKDEWRAYKRFGITGLEVRGNGWGYRRYYKNNIMPAYLTKQSENGWKREFIRLLKPSKKLYCDELVATCFCHRPDWKKPYRVKHKDHDFGNNFYGNLEWVEPKDYWNFHSQDITKNVAGKTFRMTHDGIYCSEDGIFMAGKKYLTVGYEKEDTATMTTQRVAPFIIVDGIEYDPVELIAEAWVDRDPTIPFATPILNDFNEEHLSADNISYVNGISTDYSDYQAALDVQREAGDINLICV